MPVDPIPGAPIEGAGLVFGAEALLLTVVLIAGALWTLRERPVGVLALLVIVAPLTEEVVFEVGVTWSLPILLLFGTIALFVFNPPKIHIPRTLAVWLAAFIGMILLSTTVQFLIRNGAVPVTSYTTVLRANVRIILLLSLFAFGISVLHAKTVAEWSAQSIHKLVWIHTGVAAIISALSLFWVALTYAGILPDELANIFVQPGGVTLRLSGTSVEPSQFGTYLAPSLFLAGGLASQTWPRDRRSALLVVPIALATALSYSTSAMLMLFGALVVTGTFCTIDTTLNQNLQLRNIAQKAVLTAFVAIGILLLASSLSTLVFDRATISTADLLYANTIGKLSTVTQSLRFKTLVGGFHLFIEHPIVGTGLGTHRYYSAGSNLIGYARGPSTTIVGVAAETGFLGLGAFLGLLGVLHRIALDGVRKTAGQEAFPIVLGAYLAFTSTAVGFFLNTSFESVFTVVMLTITISISTYYRKFPN